MRLKLRVVSRRACRWHKRTVARNERSFLNDARIWIAFDWFNAFNYQSKNQFRFDRLTNHFNTGSQWYHNMPFIFILLWNYIENNRHYIWFFLSWLRKWNLPYAKNIADDDHISIHCHAITASAYIKIKRWWSHRSHHLLGRASMIESVQGRFRMSVYDAAVNSEKDHDCSWWTKIDMHHERSLISAETKAIANIKT